MSNSEIAISVRGLAKTYSITHGAPKRTTFGDAVMERLRHPFKSDPIETFWALKDVSFDIKKGEVVGIIGRNGAGKSTLLKILSRITEPTSGRIRLYGRVGSLLEVGTGFHPELTGRENIYLNGAILGMTRPEIRRQFDAIVDFAEVETFLDTPVKRYSSGMYVRLAFAVAAHLNPEILIVDEVLAVGDAEFQKKCLGKMGDVAAGGRTVLFVSHNMVALRALCPGSIVLSKGQVVFSGRTSDAIRHSVNFGQHTSHPIVSHFRKITPHLDVVSARVNGSEVDTVDLASNDRVLTVDLVCRAHSPVLVELEARVVDEQGTPLAYFNPGYRDGRSHSGSGLFRICSTIQLPSIAKGRYLLDLRVTHPGIAVWADAPRAVRLNAEGSPTATGMTMDYRDFAFTLLDGNSRISAGLPEN